MRNRDGTLKNPKGRLAAQAAFCSRENSSNGVQNRQNFLAKSYEPPKRGVKIFFQNNCLIFQLLTNNVIGRTRSIKVKKKTKQAQAAPPNRKALNNLTWISASRPASG
ncbi:MAG TPA: hypothetical protein VJP04_04870 [Terriglobales bacterium]|nr:hypothetical protein [Terriglobales bacterium]